MRYTVKQPRMLLVYVLYMSIYDEGTFPLAQGTWFVLGLLDYFINSISSFESTWCSISSLESWGILFQWLVHENSYQTLLQSFLMKIIENNDIKVIPC